MSATAADHGAFLGSGLDLSQFHQVFFEEAAENLDRMERSLLGLDVASADDEALNEIFRCAHSIKGGAATFGFDDAAALTHEMETLLDRLRRHELAPTRRMVDVLLEAGDALRAQLARHQGVGGEAVRTTELEARIRALVDGQAQALAPAAPSADAAPLPAPAASPVESAAPAEAPLRQLELRVGPLERVSDADGLVELFDEIPGLGAIEPLDGGQAAEGRRRFRVTTTSSDADLVDLFSFHVAREQIALVPVGPGYGFHPGAPGTPPPAAPDPGYGFFDGAPGAPPPAGAPSLLAGPPPAASDKPAPRAERAPAAIESTTLRVSVEKVDRLVNLVGELVITQAMLAERAAGLDPALHQRLAAGLADLSRHTRDLQQSVMSIRMIPMSGVFNRFPRMLRDLGAKLGKEVELVTRGEATELDKGLVEKIVDPLTHLLRNACDHGIEPPEERLAKGKPALGTITLSASHQGGSIVIEVRDDGRGLSRAKLVAKARSRGIDAPDAMTDADAWQLIFAPGFSTAETVTDVSGRGVGMDVVKRNIAALGGQVEVDSAEGLGMRVSVRLPLTLAIMDGMSVGVGDEVYIVPLASVVDTFQAHAGALRTLGGTGRVVEVRDEYMPVLDLEQVFGVPRAAPPAPAASAAASIVVVVEADGSRCALLVHQLLGQQQVVVKNLEANYRKVDDVSGATIMGDGRVALIVDVASLVRRSRH